MKKGTINELAVILFWVSMGVMVVVTLLSSCFNPHSDCPSPPIVTSKGIDHPAFRSERYILGFSCGHDCVVSREAFDAYAFGDTYYGPSLTDAQRAHSRHSDPAR